MPSRQINDFFCLSGLPNIGLLAISLIPFMMLLSHHPVKNVFRNCVASKKRIKKGGRKRCYEVKKRSTPFTKVLSDSLSVKRAIRVIKLRRPLGPLKESQYFTNENETSVVVLDLLPRNGSTRF